MFRHRKRGVAVVPHLRFVEYLRRCVYFCASEIPATLSRYPADLGHERHFVVDIDLADGSRPL